MPNLVTSEHSTGPTSTEDRVGRYVLLEPLDTGGTARVYAAVRDGSTLPCVLKQLRLELEDNRHAKSRFQREARLAALLQHPGIARLIDAGFGDNHVFIAMEYIAGQTIVAMVRALLGKRQLVPYEVTIPIALSALDALQYAHELTGPEGKSLGIVHRDLSPRNLMLDYDGNPKVIDFGVARAEIDDYRTAPGVVVGTLRYVSPEQAIASPVDARSDLYSLGVVIYEMLTARRVTAKGDTMTVLKSVVHDIPPPISKLNPHVPRALADAVMRALDKDRERRFQSAAEMRAAIADAAGKLANTPPEALGNFLRYHFPEGEAHSRELFRRAEAEGPRETAPALAFSRFDDTEPVDADPTRADYIRPADLSDPELGSETAATSTRTDITAPGSHLPAVRAHPAEPGLEGEPLDNVTQLVASGRRTEVTSLDEAAFDEVGVSRPEAKPLANRVRPPRALGRDPALRPNPVTEFSPEKTRDPRSLWLGVIGVVALVGSAYAVGRMQGQQDPPHSRLVTPAQIEPKVEPVARPAQRYGELQDLLDALQSGGDEENTFSRLRDAISAALLDVPADQRARVEALLHAAESSRDVDDLAAALRELESRD